MAVLATQLDERADAIRQRFDSAQPFRHAIIDGFLDEAFCRQLLADFPRFDEHYARNEMGQVGGKAVRQDLPDLSPAYARLDQYLQTPEFLQTVSRLTGIENLLYDPDYVGGGTHENRHGQGLSPHVDFNYLPKTGWHRRLNLIVYLDEAWQEEWGGCLDLHSDPWDSTVDVVKRVLPAFNRCVVFETNEISWHGFEAIDLPESERHRSRRSIAIYLYTRERDPNETAPSHGTIYVPPGLPKQLQPGYTLDDRDYLELRRRFAQLKGQLKFLYRRELEESKLLASVTTALAEARAAVAFPLQGYCVQDGTVRGYWPDGWAERELAAGFKLGRACRGLELQLWMPPQLPADATVQVSVNGIERELRVRRGDLGRIEFDLRAAAGETLQLQLRCDQDFSPKAQGESADDRRLALRIHAAELRH